MRGFIASGVLALSSVATADVICWECSEVIPWPQFMSQLPGTVFPIDSRFVTAVDIGPDDGGYQLLASQAHAYARCVQSPEYPLHLSHHWGGGVITGAPGPVLAVASCGGGMPYACVSPYLGAYTAAGNAKVDLPGSELPELGVCVRSGVSTNDIDEPSYWGGASYGRAGAYMEVTYGGTGTPYYTGTVYFNSSTPAFSSVHRVVALINVNSSVSPIGILNSPNGARPFGPVTPSGDGWTGSFGGTITPNQPTTFDVEQATFTDGDLDVNGDGRFNEDDAALLSTIIAQMALESDPEERDAIEAPYLPSFDFDSDGHIDNDDVMFLESLLAAGMDSGYFGDTNRDGTVDCQDRGGLSLEGYTLDDAEYVITMDYNLDGLIDATDIAAANAWIPTADIDRNGGIDGADLGAFFALFDVGDSAVDFDHNGGIDGGDLAIFFDMFDAGC